MNQQRSKQFRASKETIEKIDEISRLREELTQKDYDLPPEKEKGEDSDSNCFKPVSVVLD
jgi:5'-3' exoribonuclease 2